MENVQIESALNELRPGLEIYLQGGVGEPLVLRELVAGRSRGRLVGVAAPDHRDGLAWTEMRTGL